MLTDIATNLVGAFLFFYLFWKRLKEDYPANALFSTSFFVSIGIGAGYLLSLWLDRSWWFWLEFVGVLLGASAGILRYKLRVYEIVEGIVFALLPWLGIFFLADSIIESALTSFLAFFSVTCLITLFAFLDSHYKNFAWYRSGRVGFSGLTTLALFFLLRAGFAPFFPFVISFTGRLEAILSGVVSFGLFLVTFNLARKTT